ncbi:MAG: DUF11 domain-containing protein, partial [Anaerolineae bacterium]|nr:DUF11 domain-containing protein [Anaerolineae bacterium]
MNHLSIFSTPRTPDINVGQRYIRKIVIAAGVALISLIGIVSIALADNNGWLAGSGSISGEPLVGGSITFDITVTNDPSGVGVFYQDRLYNVSGVIVLPPELALISCSVTPSLILQNTPAAGYTEIRFDNIKNLEVGESISLSCSAMIDPIVDIGDMFTIDYRWEAYTNPCASCPGDWRYFPGPTDADYASISATPQAFDIEKNSSTTTGEAQVNGAGGYEPAPAPGHGMGPDWPYTYTLTLTNNPLNPANQVSVFDIVPPGVAYLGNDIVSCSVLGSPSDSSPAGTLSDGSLPNTVDGSIILEWNLETLFGPGTLLSPDETCTFTYQTAIPYRERRFVDGLITSGGPFSGPIVGGPDATHENHYYATGNYEHPVNGDIPQIDGSIPGATPDDDAPVVISSSYHSITKGSSDSTVYQDTVVTYTVTGYISEYYDFIAGPGTPYIITDLIPDGLDFCSIIPPGDTDGFYDECPFVTTSALFNGAPLDPTSVALSGDDLLVTWHITDPSTVEAGDTWTLTYRAVIRDFYRNGLPVSGLDVRSNRVEATGQWNDLVSPPRAGIDTTRSTASIQVGEPAIDKLIWNPSTGSWVDGPVTLEIGQDFKYLIRLIFDDDLDMRNVIVDDFMPMGQRYIPNTADFIDSQGYGDTVPPFTPQGDQGDYSGITYQVEAAQNIGDFRIDFCPYNDTISRVDGDPSDPFLTVFENIGGGRQRLEWFLCRIDNSDTGNPIIWQVTFDGVLVDDTQVYNGCQVSNFGHLSGTNSFGTTYSLRDNLTAVYAVPNLVMRKTNTAPDPLPAPGSFSYTLSVENDGGIDSSGNAYDWTIRDIVPPGLRVPTTAGNCNGFSTTAPGNYDCMADAGAQAGTGGFVTIRPIDGLGSHDPTRPIPPATTYTFTFQAEMTDITPGATADEELFNTASIEYCTWPMPQDLDGDGSIDRRCVGYLADTIPHSDEEGTPTYDDFRDYIDADDAAPNGPGEEDNTDTSRVHIVALATNKSHTAPIHIAPQVAGDFATIGEVYQVTLEIGVPAQTVLFSDPAAGYVEVIDTFAHEGAIFCDSGSSITGCDDPVLAQIGGLVNPDIMQNPAAPHWWQATNTSPNPGSSVRFFFDTIDNSIGALDYTFTITFTMVVTGRDDAGNAVFFPPATNDIVSNSFVVRYFNDNPTPEEFTTIPAGDRIDIDQPHISTDKEAVSITRPGVGVLCDSAATCNSIQVQGNDVIAYQMTYVSDGESTAFDVSMIDWLTVYATYNSDMICISDTVPPVSGGVVASSSAPAPYTIELLMDTTPSGGWDLPPGNRVTCSYTITVEPTVPAGTTLSNFTDADWSTLDGSVPGERVFEDNPDDGAQDEDTETLQVIIPVAGKTRLSPGPTGPGTLPPVRIGDVIDYRITIPLPIGRTQNIVISDYLDPGLIYYESGTFSVRTNSLDPLSHAETLTGSNDGIGAFSVDWAVWDPACTPVIGATNCIYNDGANNTVVIVDFQAIVANVPLNLNGLVLDNDMQASFLDGLGNPGVITHGGALNDEEVLVTEPHLTLSKSALPTAVDAGDTLTYSVVITNDGTATAYDVSFDENLDDRVDYDTAYTMQCAHSVSGPLAYQIDLAPFDGSPDVPVASMDIFRVAGALDENSNGWDLAPGESITCAYRVTVLDTVMPGYTIDNVADADWSSLDGAVSGGPTEPNERRYDDSGADAAGFPGYTEIDDQDTSTATVPAPTLTKDRISGATVQPGQTVSYQIVITLPEGTVDDLTITDTLPLPAGAFRFESVTPPVAAWGGALPAFSAQPAAGDTGTLIWTFDGPITNPGDNNAANDTITLTYTIRVYSNAVTGNNANTAQASYTNEAGGTSTTNTDTATVNVIRPANTTTKTASVTTADAGDTITYTVTIRNSGPAGTVAYDVYFNENLSDYTDYDTSYAMTCTHSADGALTFEMDDLADGFDTTPDAFTGTLDRFRIAGDLTENDNPWELASGQTIACTYRVIVLDSVQPGGTGVNAIRNTIT